MRGHRLGLLVATTTVWIAACIGADPQTSTSRDDGGTTSGDSGQTSDAGADAAGGDAGSDACAPTPAGLLSWWDGENSAADRTGLNNGAVFGSVGYAPGKVGTAFKFDKSSFVKATTASFPVGGDPRTIELWVSFDTLPVTEEGFIAGWGAPDQCNQFTMLSLGSETDGGTGHFFSAGIWCDGVVQPPRIVTTGTFHHVAATLFGGAMTLYVDGASFGTKSVNAATPPSTEFRIGKLDTTTVVRASAAIVDEVSVYSRALGASEIAAIYAAGSAGKCK